MSTVSVANLEAVTNGSLRAVATYDRDGIDIVFERAVHLHAGNGTYSGTFVSVDTGAGVNLDRLVGVCHDSRA